MRFQTGVDRARGEGESDMLEEVRVQEKESEQRMAWSESTLALESVLQLLSQLEQADMLKSEFTPPGEWILWSEVPVSEWVSALHQHLSKLGWQRIVEAMHWHNRNTEEPRWDLARADDFMAAVDLALERRHNSGNGETGASEDWTPVLQRQVEGLIKSQLEPAGVTGWLMSPRALAERLSSRARQARAATQVESAVSEAALHAARMAGRETQRTVALSRVERLRDQMGEQLKVFCDEQGLALPRPYSREEAYCLHLLNAYFIALAEAEGAIARRGANLARRQIELEGKRAEARMDDRMLPGLLQAQREINPMREAYFRESVRHKLALVVSGILGALAGGLWGILESVTDVFINGLARRAVVTAPALLVGLLTLVAQTLAYSGPFTLSIVSEFFVRAAWNGALALAGTILAYGCWQYYQSRQQEPEVEMHPMPEMPKVRETQ